MMQISTGKEIYIIDFYVIQPDEILFSITKDWISLLMSDPKIEKIFFDCRKDAEALHKKLKCCVQNVYDIQAMHMTISQLRSAVPLKNLGDIIMPGLNVSLDLYRASHGINKSKNIMKVYIPFITEIRNAFRLIKVRLK